MDMLLNSIAKQLVDGQKRSMKNSLKVSKDLFLMEDFKYFYIAMSLFGRDWKKVEQHIGTRSGA
jgi:hypothetical protein